jgi:hypothetical protein
VPENVRLLGVNPIDADVVGAERASVTGMVLVAAPMDATLMATVYVPAARPEVFTLAQMLPEFVPFVELRASHEALSLAAHERVPVPVFVTSMP